MNPNLNNLVETNKEIIDFVRDWNADEDVRKCSYNDSNGIKPETKYVGTLDYATAKFNTILLRLAEHPLTIDEHTSELLDCHFAIQHFYKNTKRLMTWPKITHSILRLNLHGIGTRKIPKVKKLLNKLITNVDGRET